MLNYEIISDKKLKKSSKIVPLKGKRDVSIVVPSYNEEDNIIPLIGRISSSLKEKHSYEVIIIDDNSKDKTKSILTKKALKDDKVVAVFRKGIRGIWSAQLDGIRLSRGNTIVLMDADLSHPPEIIPNMLKKIPEYDFVSASRYIKGGGLEGLPPKHYFSTIAFNKVMKLIMGLKATDYTGVFHAIKKDKLLTILPKKYAIGGAFDLDLLYKAKKKRLKFVEVPFIYRYRMQGKSKSKKMRVLALAYGIRAIKLRLFGRA
jgi:dolichol-phosphate mannosyltransferase